MSGAHDIRDVGKARRNRDPSLYRLITIRTDEARLWMIPSTNLEKIVGGVLARYQEMCGILIFAYSFLSNHYHLLIRAPKENTDEFCMYLNREIARRVNWKNRREGKFWHRPYSDQKVLTEADVLEAFLYISTNAVKHGLVDHPSKWTGLNSYRQIFTESTRTFTFYHFSKQNVNERTSRHSIRLSPLPEFSKLTKSERSKILARLIEERTLELATDRKAQGKGFLGIKAVLAQTPGSVPREIAKSPRPPCYSKDAVAIYEFKKIHRARENLYCEASMRYRLGDMTIEFPQYSYKPPLHIKPRLVPFTPLPEDHFKKAA